jgi:hypothetical protein
LRNKLIACGLLALACSAHVSAQSAKRGFVGNPIDATDLQAASTFGWYYNWDQQPPAGNTPANVEDYVEYVPMAWGAHFDQQTLINYLLAHPRVTFILGFNEPNFKGQSNLTPSQAAAAWPALQAIADRFNLTIVGPAINFSFAGGAVVENGVEYTDPVKWYEDFFAACKGCRVDHIAIHGYFSEPGYLPWMIGLFDKFNKPVWVTEFNQSPSASVDAAAQYMRAAVPLLENDPRVFRYAWFLGRGGSATTNLFGDQAGVLTNLGNVYQCVRQPARRRRGGHARPGWLRLCRQGRRHRAHRRHDGCRLRRIRELSLPGRGNTGPWLRQCHLWRRPAVWHGEALLRQVHARRAKHARGESGGVKRRAGRGHAGRRWRTEHGLDRYRRLGALCAAGHCQCRDIHHRSSRGDAQ